MIKKLLIVTLILVYGCSADYDVSDKELANSTFEPYFEIFKEEAKKRGNNFDDYVIEFYFADINEDHVGAFANYDNNEVVFDRNNWRHLDPTEKEIIVFHELGHSILKRRHMSGSTDSGECLSYMRESKDFCFKNNYSNLWREYYLDELFDSQTPLPDWYLNNNEYNIQYNNKNQILDETNNTNKNFSFGINSDTIPKYVLEVTFKNWRPLTEIYSVGLTQSININGLYIICQPRLEVYVIGINDIDDFLKKDDYNFENEIKFTIRKNENLYQFFLNEKFVHASDSNIIENHFLNIDYDRDLKKDIKLFSYE